MENSEDLYLQLQQALAECARLREENARLRVLCNLSPERVAAVSEPILPIQPFGAAVISEIVSKDFTPEAKVALFRSLFRGREDVYALRWEGRSGRSGYSPACAREWEPSFDGISKPKPVDSQQREYFPLTDAVIRNHLLGKHTVDLMCNSF
jgi:hypothetical protein